MKGYRANEAPKVGKMQVIPRDPRGSKTEGAVARLVVKRPAKQYLGKRASCTLPGDTKGLRT